MGDAFLEFSDVFYEDLGFLNPGRIKLADNAIQFKNEKTGKLLTINAKDLGDVKWIRLGNQPGIRFSTEDGKRMRFGGFKDSDYDKIKSFASRNWNQDVEQQELALKGWNYGKCEVDGRTIEFSVDGKPAFEVGLHNVSNCVPGKNEATLEFHPNDDAQVCLTEMRFHMPADPEDEEADPVAAFHAAVMRFAGVEAETGQAIANLSQILCTTPRGRYDIKVFANHLSLHGKTYDYKIPINTIMRLFLVPHKDGRHVYFVISLSPPIRQGQTRYHFLVLEFAKDEEVDLELGLSEEQIKEQYNGKLEKELSGPLYEVVSKIFRVLINMKITVPGHFIGHSGTPAVQCAHKQASGFLYPLEKGFLYVHKPPMYIRFEEVSSVHFARSDVSTRSFDFEIEMKNGQNLIFNSVEKEEYNKLFDYVQNKKLRIRNARKLEKNYAEDAFAGSDEEVDRYGLQMKKEGREKDADMSSEESDSEDEDYDVDKDKKRQQQAKDSSEGSGSEPDEEYDSGAESDDTGSGESEPEDDEDGTKKKKKHKEPSAKTVKEPKERKSRKHKKEKDPNAPKRPQSAYFLWLNENRATIRKTGDAVSDTAKRAGEMWKAMSEEEKRPWEKKAKEDKDRYTQEMTEYKKSGGGPSSSGSSKKKNISPTKSPAKAKSREFVSDDDDSSDEDDKPLASTSAAAKKKDEKKEKQKKKKESDDEEEEEELADTPDTDEDSD